ncbi:protein hypothetical protein [Limosa lapponica baueri]|uniref:FAM194 C-terminal domain-containing protein n=1 Tax=Limosa lapponica baueri TaxID=1758121 RepID=A0A2I0U1P1_LIMLA|nr:protein hypothetical protein [Limosa lapponica baueri]
MMGPQLPSAQARTYKEKFDDIIQDLMSEDEAEEEELDITSHAEPSEGDMKNSIKEKLLQHYPSGNVAILITFSEEALFTYCILEDSRYPGIRAAFGSHGHGVCFHPDGHLWASLNPCTGICLDQERARQKCWSWHDFSHHTHSPPFQSIIMKLNGYITIKILAQDQIDLSFTSHSDCIHFNMGSQLKGTNHKPLDDAFLQYRGPEEQYVGNEKLWIDESVNNQATRTAIKCNNSYDFCHQLPSVLLVKAN